MRKCDFLLVVTRKYDLFIVTTHNYVAYFRNYGSQCDRSYGVIASQFQRSRRHGYGSPYALGQFEPWPLDDAMVVVYHSWTTSHHYINRLITSNRIILSTNPSNAPIGTFIIQRQRRFHVENLCISFVPNSFYFANTTKTIYLMTDGSYDPTKAQIISPVIMILSYSLLVRMVFVLDK